MPTLYFFPASTTSRPVAFFAADAGIALEEVPVNLLLGEHLTAAFTAINPNQAVPVLEHDGMILTECSAILKYLADLNGSPAYPADLKARAQVNRWMDWFISLFASDFNYGIVYPQILPHYAISAATDAERRAWHSARVAKRLKVLDLQLADGGPYICGDAVTLADYLGVCFITNGELVDFDFSPWPHVQRWIATMKARPAWCEVHAAFYGWRAALQQQRTAA
jgi:glutathione S-transferase